MARSGDTRFPVLVRDILTKSSERTKECDEVRFLVGSKHDAEADFIKTDDIQ